MITIAAQADEYFYYLILSVIVAIQCKQIQKITRDNGKCVVSANSMKKKKKYNK